MSAESGRGRVEKLRWRVAELVNRLPGQCWADLVGWALDGWDPDGEKRPWTTPARLAQCQADAARCGSCYCGKIQDEAGVRRWKAEWAVRDAHRQGPRPDGSWGCACGWEQDKPHREHVAELIAAVPS